MNINIRCVALFVLIIPLLKTPYINKVYFLDLCFNLFRLVSGCIIVFIYLSRQQVSKIVLMQMLFQAVLLFSTVLNDGDLYNQILTAISVISFYLIAEMGIRDSCTDFLRVIMLCSEIMVYINLLTLIIFPNGMYQDWTYRNWFLGTDNQHIGVLLVSVCVALIYRNYFGKKIRPYLLMAACVISIFLCWSATSVGGIVLFGFLYFAAVKRNNPVFNYVTYMIIISAIFVFIILLRLQNYFEFIIVDLLGKEITFTGRVDICDAGIYWIKKAWLLGNGVESYSLHAQKTIYPSMHNTFLEYLYQGGIVLFLIFIGINVMLGLRLMKDIGNKYTKIISAVIFTFYFMMQFEVYSSIFIELIFVLAFFIQELKKQSEEALDLRVRYQNRRKVNLTGIPNFRFVLNGKGDKTL